MFEKNQVGRTFKASSVEKAVERKIVRRHPLWRLAALLILVLALAPAGCLPAPGSKAKSATTSGPSDRRSPEERHKAYLNLASALMMEREYTMALVELEKAKAINPDSIDLNNLLGMAYFGLSEYKLSSEYYLKALEMNPKRSDVRNNLGMVYLAQKQYDQALTEFSLAGQDLTFEQKHLPMSNIGMTYLEMGNYDEALTALKKVTAFAPQYAVPYKLMGRIYLAKGQKREAVDYLNNAARLNPDDPETYMLLGETLAGLGRIQDGAEAYGRVATLVPRTTMAMEAQKKARYLMGFD